MTADSIVTLDLQSLVIMALIIGGTISFTIVGIFLLVVKYASKFLQSLISPPSIPSAISNVMDLSQIIKDLTKENLSHPNSDDDEKKSISLDRVIKN